MKSMIKTLVQTIAPIYPQAKRWLHKFNGGIFPKYYKELSASQPVKDLYIPDKLIIPLQQQVGLPAELMVKVGDKVKKNQLIGRSSKDATKALVVPVHAPTSGVIVAIEEHTLPHPSGLKDLAVVINPDHQDEAIENVLEVDGSHPQSPDQLKSVILNAGIVGMGGAGFPTYAKIPVEKNKVHTIIINGAECEPFITCDDLLMQTQAQRIVQGALITAEALGAETIYCGIETNKPSAIKAMRDAAQNTVIKIEEVETVYPMGGQKQLTQELTGTEIPHDAHAIDLGILMMNVATFAAIANAVEKGEPLTSRMISVTGLGLEKPFNIHALIGTSFEELAKLAQPKSELNYPLIMGGPMMGFKVSDNSVPVTKTTNCILANPPEPTEMQMPCIRCGECMDACPINLLPQQMYWHSQAHEFEKVDKLNVFDCIECGCCSYVCPSHIPLVQYYRHAKSEIKEMRAEEKATELAKQRHEFKLARIEREKQEREARLKAKKEAVKKQAQAQKSVTTDNTDDKTGSEKPKGAAAAAAKAAAARRAAAKNKTVETETEANIPPARKKAIEAAKKAAANKAKQETDSTPTSKPDAADPRAAAKKAAMAAAKKRAQAKKQAAVEAANEAANQAAQKSAEAAVEQIKSKQDDSKDFKEPNENISDLTEVTEETSASKKEKARKAAMAAARASAKKRKQASATADQNIETKETEETTSSDTNSANSLTAESVEDKKAKAMRLAKQAAAKRAAKKKAQKTDEETS